MIKNFLEIEPIIRPIHSGEGVTKSVKLFGENDLLSNLKLVSFSTLEPNSSIGFHHHTDKREEVYVILNGTGVMTIDEELYNVKKGDVILTPMNSGHGLLNNGTSNLELFIFWVKVDEKEI